MSMNKYNEAEQALNPNNDGTDVSNKYSTLRLMLLLQSMLPFKSYDTGKSQDS